MVISILPLYLYSPDGRNLQDIPLHGCVELRQVHANVHYVGVFDLVHMSQIHLKYEIDINSSLLTASIVTNKVYLNTYINI